MSRAGRGVNKGSGGCFSICCIVPPKLFNWGSKERGFIRFRAFTRGLKGRGWRVDGVGQVREVCVYGLVWSEGEGKGVGLVWSEGKGRGVWLVGCPGFLGSLGLGLLMRVIIRLC
jgi:hypothetical protein